MRGTIKRLVRDKKFGFVRSDESGTEYFFHSSGCLCEFDGLKEGQAVQFEPGQGPKGPRAEGVEPTYA